MFSDMAPHTPAYHREKSERSRMFLQFDKYMLRRKGYRKEMKLQLYHSRAEGTIRTYTGVIKSYVTYMHEKEDASPFPVTESSLRRYIDSLDLTNRILLQQHRSSTRRVAERSGSKIQKRIQAR